MRQVFWTNQNRTFVYNMEPQLGNWVEKDFDLSSGKFNWLTALNCLPPGGISFCS